ncbi:MAG: hypothetical protein AAF658_06045, partial [Myxococcota bacterium]
MRALGLTLLLLCVAACGGTATSAQLESARSACPSADWTDSFVVSPDTVVAGGTDTVAVQWRVFNGVQAPFSVSFEAPLADATATWTLELVMRETEFPDVLVLEASG